MGGPRRRAGEIGGAGGGANPSVFDASALARLHELDPGAQRGFVVQVLRTYETSLLRHLERLAVEPPDPRLASEVAHTLKSSSAAVGALSFSTCCSRLEKAAKAGPEGDFMPALADMREQGQQVLAAVRAMLRP